MRIVFLIFVFVSISANSQIKNLNLELSSSYVTDLKIQENGLMWVEIPQQAFMAVLKIND